MADDKDQIPVEIRDFFRKFGKYGALGGKATSEKLTPKQRTRKASKAGKAGSAKLTPAERKARAQAAAAARWGKEKKV